MKSFIIGNGKSRKDFDLDALSFYGKTYGCNALYRDWSPDVLIAHDQEMVDEIVESDYNNKHICILGEPKEGDLCYKWFAGTHAIYETCTVDKPDEVYLIGFDFDTDEKNMISPEIDELPGWYREIIEDDKHIKNKGKRIPVRVRNNIYGGTKGYGKHRWAEIWTEEGQPKDQHSILFEKFLDIQFIWGAPAEWLVEDIFRPHFVYPNCRYFSYKEILKKLRNEKLDG